MSQRLVHNAQFYTPDGKWVNYGEIYEGDNLSSKLGQGVFFVLSEHAAKPSSQRVSAAYLKVWYIGKVTNGRYRELRDRAKRVQRHRGNRR